MARVLDRSRGWKRVYGRLRTSDPVEVDAFVRGLFYCGNNSEYAGELGHVRLVENLSGETWPETFSCLLVD